MLKALLAAPAFGIIVSVMACCTSGPCFMSQAHTYPITLPFDLR